MAAHVGQPLGWRRDRWEIISAWVQILALSVPSSCVIFNMSRRLSSFSEKTENQDQGGDAHGTLGVRARYPVDSRAALPLPLGPALYLGSWLAFEDPLLSVLQPGHGIQVVLIAPRPCLVTGFILRPPRNDTLLHVCR